MQNILITEEDLKNKLVLPYLQSLGVSSDEIQFETSFSIRLGKSENTVSKVVTAGGRSDILCKKGDVNLFIIEVKADNLNITDSDVDQAISYARLVHPIAPFVIVTNGKETRIVDTIEKKDLQGYEIGSQSNFWKNGCKLAASEEFEKRYEALLNFIGLSSANLSVFSRYQVDSRMLTLKGSVAKVQKKYIPELWIERRIIHEQFNDYLKSSSIVFAMIGESGVGKTNLICGLAERAIGDHVVLFYNAADINGDIVGNIRDDFNWFFSPQLEAVEIVKRLDELAHHENRRVCIFIDAIDEASASNFIQDLNDLVRKIQQYPHVKICVTCKSLEWNNFLTLKGNPTYIAEHIYEHSSAVNTDQENRVIKKMPGIYVTRFDNDELNLLDSKYRSVFKYRGNLIGETKRECSLGFMLRIIAEVYEGKELPQTIDDVAVLKAYLIKKLEKTDKELSLNYLDGVGSALLHAGKDGDKKPYLSDRVEESHLRRFLSMKPSDKLPDELFTYNILSRSESADGLNYVGFYYTKIRDFVVATYSLKLSSKTDVELREVIPSLFESPVGLSVLSWYNSIAKDSHRKILLEYRQTRALVFLNEYTRLIETHFPAIKDRFEPFTSGLIGLVISGHQNALQAAYGFRPLQDADNSLLDVLPVLSREELSLKLYKMGVATFKSRSKDFISTNPVSAARDEVVEQLQEIIKRGHLNESGNEGLAIEKAIAIIYNNSQELGYPKPTIHNWLPDLTHIFPISCAEVERRIKLIYAREYYQNEAIQEAIDAGRIKTQRSGSILSYQFSPQQLNYADIEQKAQAAVEGGIVIPPSRVIGKSQLYSVLLDAIKTIQHRYSEISSPPLPSPDIAGDQIYATLHSRGGRTGSIPQLICSQYSEEQFKKYIEVFFRRFFEEYKIMVDTCFPTLKNRFEFYSALPSGVYVEFDTEMNSIRGGSLQFGYKYDSTEPAIEVVFRPTTTRYTLDERDTFRSWHSRSLDSIFRDYQPTPLVNVGGYGGVGIYDHSSEMCPLRNFVYDQIENDLKTLLEDKSVIA